MEISGSKWEGCCCAREIKVLQEQLAQCEASRDEFRSCELEDSKHQIDVLGASAIEEEDQQKP